MRQSFSRGFTWGSGGPTTVSASSRLNHYTGSYVNTSGTVVATDWNDLVDGSGVNNFQTELGNGMASATWTNTTASGGIISTNISTTCNNWTDGTSGRSAYIGHSAGGNPDSWTNYGSTDACSDSNNIYCMEQ